MRSATRRESSSFLQKNIAMRMASWASADRLLYLCQFQYTLEEGKIDNGAGCVLRMAG
jgi:hypothetical protein